jgi:hypothetical protein
MLAVGEIKVAGFNPASRTEAGKLRDLKREIEADGKILEPLWVTPDGILVDGHRRLACAKALGYEQVPALIVEGDPLTLFRKKNGQQMHLTPVQWLDFYSRGGEPPKRMSRPIQEVQRLVGEDGLSALVQMRKSPNYINMVRSISEYCGDTSDEFMRQVFWWLLKRRQQFAVRRAMADEIPPDILTQAIQEDKTIGPRWEIKD